MLKETKRAGQLRIQGKCCLRELTWNHDIYTKKWTESVVSHWKLCHEKALLFLTASGRSCQACRSPFPRSSGRRDLIWYLLNVHRVTPSTGCRNKGVSPLFFSYHSTPLQYDPSIIWERKNQIFFCFLSASIIPQASRNMYVNVDSKMGQLDGGSAIVFSSRSASLTSTYIFLKVGTA